MSRRHPESWDPPLILWAYLALIFALAVLNIANQIHHQNDGGAERPAVEEIDQP